MDPYIFTSSNTITESRKISALWSLIKYSSNFFFSLGKPDPWGFNDNYFGYTDEKPPTADNNLRSIPDPIIYKRVEDIKLAKKSACGDTFIQGENWTLYNKESIEWINGEPSFIPSHLYISTRLHPDEILTNSFRIIGFHSDVRLRKSLVNPNKLVFPPSEIEDSGILHWVMFSSPIYKKDNKLPSIELLLKT